MLNTTLGALQQDEGREVIRRSPEFILVGVAVMGAVRAATQTAFGVGLRVETFSGEGGVYLLFVGDLAHTQIIARGRWEGK